MYTHNNGQVEMTINIKEILGNLLEQWKVVLITALLVMALFVGLKYAKDMKSYIAAQTKKNAETQSTISAEERIAEILDKLPENERSTVITIIKQNDWIESEKEYINNSILMNTDPTNQRTLVADYYVNAAEESDSIRNSLIIGYKSYINDKEVAESLGKLIKPNTETKYISELISVNNSESSEGKLSFDAILEVCVVLPDGTDSKAVEETLTSLLKEQSPEMSNRICPHSIDLVSAKETYLYNKGAVYEQTNILYSIFNLQNNTMSMQSALSDGQKAAVESIIAIKSTEKTTAMGTKKIGASDIENTKPEVSKKYALLGFVLGVLVYAFIYFLIVIRRGCLLCADDASFYTEARLLGELYEQTKLSGIKALFKSRFIEKYRYGNKLDTIKQIEKMRSSIEAVCKHEGLKELTVFDQSAPEKMKDTIIREIRNLGIKVTEISAGEDINEKELCDVDDAVFLTGNMTKVSALCGLTGLLRDYDIRTLGAIYAAEL